MKKATRIFLFTAMAVCIFGNNLQAQETVPRKLLLSVRAGVDLPTTGMFNGEVTDYLIGFRNSSTLVFPQLTFEYYVNNRIGFDIDIQNSFGPAVSSRSVAFNNAIAARFTNFDYFVIPSADAVDQSSFRSTLGVVYRWEYGKFLFFNRVFFGATIITVENLDVVLKEKDTHIYYNLDWNYGEEAQVDFFTVGTSFTAAYPLTNRILVSAQINYGFFNNNLVFKEQLTNLFTEEVVQTRDIVYNNSVHAISFTAGLTFDIQRKK